MSSSLVPRALSKVARHTRRCYYAASLGGRAPWTGLLSPIPGSPAAPTGTAY